MGSHSKQRQARQRRAVRQNAFRRNFRVEQLEDRRLMAVGAPPMEMWQSQDRVAGTILARFVDEASTTQIHSLAGDAGLAVEHLYEGNIAVLSIDSADQFQPAVDPLAKAAALWSDPLVVYAEPDFVVTPQRFPNDPLYSQQWGLNNIGQDIFTNSTNPLIVDTGTALSHINAESIWNAGVGSKDVVVAVIDTGVDYFHPDLRANMWRNPGEVPDGIDNDQNGFVDDIWGWNTAQNNNDPMDTNGHGTHVAGIIGAVGDNGVGIAGVNWNVSLMAIKAGNPGFSTSALVGAYNYVSTMKQRGVNIVATNNSYGGVGLPLWSFAERDSIDRMINQGVAFIAAAGNNGVNADVTPFYPNNYEQPGVISVAATDNDDNLAGFSNWGPTNVDIGAPGVNILSTVPATYPVSTTVFQTGTGAQQAKYALFNGTSMASPMVAGAYALIKSLRPEMTVPQVKQLLMDTSDRIPSLEFRVRSEGRLNLAAAVNSLPHAEIQGTVFNDFNGNGFFDANETGLGGATVYVDANNNGALDSGEASATSGPDGSYTLNVFTGAGNKTIRQVPLPNFSLTVGANGITRNLQIPSVVTGVNFGNRGVPGGITGRVINDVNRNEILDAGEGGAANVLVYLDANGDGRLNIGESTTRTDVSGNYAFFNVSPGTHTVRLATSSGWEAAIPDPANPGVLGVEIVNVNTSTITPNVDFFVTSNFDWGDSPASYNLRPGTSIVDPPVHGILPNLYIGKQNSPIPGVDGEDGPQFSDNASGDSAAGVDDEPDGDIIFVDELVAGGNPRLQVHVTTGNNPQALLQGWIDFNRNGVFESTEQIVRNARVGNGVFETRFNVPSTFNVGVNIARFRLGYEQDLGPTGPAFAGEVADIEVRVFGPQPRAEDDPDAFGNRYTVIQNSNELDPDNTFDILANDVRSLTGEPQIAFVGATPQIGSSPGALGNMTTELGGTLFYVDAGIIGDRTDDVVRYKPPVGKFGNDQFFYQVTDGVNVGNIATVFINILPANPIARDDTETVSTQTKILDVLGNDLARGEFQTGGPNIEIVGVPTLPAGTGTLTVLPVGHPSNPFNHEVLQYDRGAAAFTGSFQFTYRMNDLLNPVPVGPTATVTMQVVPISSNLVPPNAQVRVRSEVIGPGTAAPGNTVQVAIFVQDLRDDPLQNDGNPNLRETAPYMGVISLGVDLLYDPIFVRPLLNGDGSVQITYGAGFIADPSNVGNLTDPSIIAPGLIDEIAAVFVGDVSTVAGQEQRLATLTFEVLNPNVADRPPGSNVTRFIVNPGEDPTPPLPNENHEVFVYDGPALNPVRVDQPNVFYTGIYYDFDAAVGPGNLPDERNDLTVGASLLAMGEGEFTNSANRLDVNYDKTVNIVDAIAVIQSLRGSGGNQALQPVEFMALSGASMPKGFVDVNRDGQLNIQDAMDIIRYLRASAHSGGGEGESAALFTAPTATSNSSTQAPASTAATDLLFATDSFLNSTKSSWDDSGLEEAEDDLG